MSKSTITLLSKLPLGLLIDLHGHKVRINGTKLIDGVIIPGETTVTSEEWEGIKTLHKGQDYILKNYIWEKVDSKAGNAESAQAARSNATDGLNPADISTSPKSKKVVE